MNKLIFLSNQDKKERIKKATETFQREKYMSCDDLIKKYYFDYDVSALIFIMNKYKYSYDHAKEILKLLIYIEDKAYHSKKIKEAIKIKEELEAENLLIKDKHFKNYLKRFDLYYIGDNLDPFTQKTLDNISAMKKRSKLKNSEAAFNFKSFKTLDDEIEALYQEIAFLLDKGVKTTDIKVLSVDDEYEHKITLLNQLFPFNLKKQNLSLNSFEISKEYLTLIKEMNLSDALLKLKEICPEEKYKPLYRELLKNINQITELELDKETEILILSSLFKDSKFNLETYQNEIVIDSIETYSPQAEDYVFILNASQNNFPKLRKDDDYLNDEEKYELGIESSKEYNQRQKLKLFDIIKVIKNLYISYHEESDQGEKILSSVFKEPEIKIIESEINNKVYSEALAKLKLSKYLDDFYNFGIIDENLAAYKKAVDIDYKTFNNKFKALSKESLDKIFEKKLNLSYSSLKNYNACSFMFYLENILKLNPYEENFYTIIGNVFHKVLEDYITDDKELELLWVDAIKNINLNPREEILLNNLKEELKLIVEEIKNFHEQSEFKNILSEARVEIDLDEKTIFKGFVDKVMHYEKDGADYLALIDYKTGSEDINLDYLDFGFNMQLPIYWYLIKRSGYFSNPKFTGIYLQEILSNKSVLKQDENIDEVKRKNLKLKGYSTDKQSVLKDFDSSFETSDYISSLRLTSGGEFYKTAKVLSDQDIEDMDKKVDKLIKEAKDNIYKGNFDINPKSVNNKLLSCKYCVYEDICFKKAEDTIYLKKESADK